MLSSGGGPRTSLGWLPLMNVSTVACHMPPFWPTHTNLVANESNESNELRIFHTQVIRG